MSEACQPSLSIACAEKPGWSVSTMKNEIPPWPPSGVVFAADTIQSARTPLVMNIFEPLSVQPPSTSRALVRSPATSDPASGSVIPSAAIVSPLIAGAR